MNLDCILRKKLTNEYRLSLKLTITQLANILKIKPSFIANWASGNRSIPVWYVIKLACLYSLNIDKLFNNETENPALNTNYDLHKNKKDILYKFSKNLSKILELSSKYKMNDFPYHYSVISRLKNGNRIPSNKQLSEISNHLKIQINDLLNSEIYDINSLLKSHFKYYEAIGKITLNGNNIPIRELFRTHYHIT